MARDALESVDIPAGLGGINRTKNLSKIPPTDYPYVDSVTIERDLIEKLPGASHINTAVLAGSPVPQVLGVWDFFSASPIVQELLAYLDDGNSAKVVTVDATGIVKTLVSGLTTGGFPWFVEGWTGTTKAVYLYNGKDSPQVYTGGATMMAVPSPAADWGAGNQPSAASMSHTRIAAWGNANFPHHLYLTVPAVHGDFTAGESALQRVYPGEGDGIKGGLFWRNKLYLGKSPQGIYFLDDSDPSIANWEVPRVTGAFGIGGPGCFLDIEDDLVVLGTDGYFYALTSIRTLGQIEAPPILPMETGNFLKEKLNLNALNIVRSVWFANKRQMWWAVPTGASTVCNALIIIDLHQQATRLLYSSRDVCPGLALRRPSGINSARKPCFGDNAGFLWQADQTARNKNGAAYNGQYETPPIALYPGGKQRGNLKELILTQNPQGNFDLTVEVDRDGQVGQTLAFSQNTPGAPVGSISLDADVLAGQTITNVRHRLEGDCRFVKLIGKNANANETFAVMNHKVRYTPGNDRG